MTIYVSVSGVHGSAWISSIKDVLILLVIGFLGVYIPTHYYGGLEAMFDAVSAAKPGFAALGAPGHGVVWYCTTVIISSFGMFMWPHTFASIFASRSEDSFRRNSVIMPVYALVMLLSMLVGFAAVLKVPGLHGGDIDLALLKLSARTFDPWFLGVIGGAGLLTALVPGSMMLVAASSLIANNVYGRLHRSAPSKRIAVVARLSVPCFTLLAVYFTLVGTQSIVSLLIVAFTLVSQLFPALFFSLLERRVVNAFGAAAGIVVGAAAASAAALTNSTIATLLPMAGDRLGEVNMGLVAMILNIVVMLAVSLATGPLRTGSATRAKVGTSHLERSTGTLRRLGAAREISIRGEPSTEALVTEALVGDQASGRRNR